MSRAKKVKFYQISRTMNGHPESDYNLNSLLVYSKDEIYINCSSLFKDDQQPPFLCFFFTWLSGRTTFSLAAQLIHLVVRSDQRSNYLARRKWRLKHVVAILSCYKHYYWKYVCDVDLKKRRYRCRERTKWRHTNSSRQFSTFSADSLAVTGLVIFEWFCLIEAKLIN